MRYKKFAAAVMAAGFLLSGGVFLGGCGSSQQAAGQKQAIKVTTFKPFKSDTPIMREYTGTGEIQGIWHRDGKVYYRRTAGDRRPASVSAGYKELQFSAG